jgi:hypothetical protein
MLVCIPLCGREAGGKICNLDVSDDIVVGNETGVLQLLLEMLFIGVISRMLGSLSTFWSLLESN